MERTQDFIFTEEEIAEVNQICQDAGSFKSKLLKKIKEAKKDADEGNIIPAEEGFARIEEELRRYGCI